MHPWVRSVIEDIVQLQNENPKLAGLPHPRDVVDARVKFVDCHIGFGGFHALRGKEDWHQEGVVIFLGFWDNRDGLHLSIVYGLQGT